MCCGRWSGRLLSGTTWKGPKPKMLTQLNILKTWFEAKFVKDERGASLVEYILLVALIALAVIAAVMFLAGGINSKFNEAGSKLQ